MRKQKDLNKRNYAKELDSITEGLQKEGRVPTLLLQCCCAPCSSACLERLREDFHVTVFFYNPNISETLEYEKRKAELVRLIHAYNRQVDEGSYDGMLSTKRANRIEIRDCNYDGAVFEAAARGMENIPEGGERCTRCFALRLEKTAAEAKKQDFDYFTTTLTISPLKDADRLNKIGEAMGEKYGIPFLPSDFKKKDGYKRSIELSKRFGLYRQDYCGCRFSKAESERRRKERASRESGVTTGEKA